VRKIQRERERKMENGDHRHYESSAIIVIFYDCIILYQLLFTITGHGSHIACLLSFVFSIICIKYESRYS